MKIAVAGAGAMGCLIGGSLARAGEKVHLLCRSSEQAAAIAEEGLRLTYRGETAVIPVHATARPAEVGVCDVVLVMTKHRHTRDALESARPAIGPRTLLASLQNGIGNVEILADFAAPERILYGVTGLGAMRTAPAALRATVIEGVESHMWPAAGEPSPAAKDFVAALNRCGFDVRLSPDVRERVWQKLCVNAGFSSLCAILRLPVAAMLEQPAARDLVRSLVYEIAAVGRREGVAMDGEEAFQRVWALAERSPEHVPSFLVDVLNRRKTEVDCLNGAIVERAHALGLPVPVNETVLRMVTVIENSYDARMG